MLCLTDTSLYIYICVKHFRVANFKLIMGQRKNIFFVRIVAWLFPNLILLDNHQRHGISHVADGCHMVPYSRITIRPSFSLSNDVSSAGWNIFLQYIMSLFDTKHWLTGRHLTLDFSSLAWFIDWLTLGSSPYRPQAPRPYRRTLCVPLSTINSGQPCSFTTVPDKLQI